MIAVVASGWEGALVAWELHSLGQPVKLVWREPDFGIPRGLYPVYVGNGEHREKSNLIYGRALTDAWWEVSLLNLEIAKTDWSLPPIEVRWEVEATVDAGVLLDAGAFESTLLKLFSDEGVGVQRTRGVTAFSSEHSLQGTLHLAGGDTVEADLFVIATSWVTAKVFPFFQDRWIPVTLPRFVFEKQQFGEGLELHHRGADFVLARGKQLVAGSYRNLFQDRAVGIHLEPDPVSLENVSRWVADQGWAGSYQRAWLDLEITTCDGLPLVGSLPEHPNVVVAGGFNGKRPNFFFAVAKLLAQALSLSGSKHDQLDIFSTKRFC